MENDFKKLWQERDGGGVFCFRNRKITIPSRGAQLQNILVLSYQLHQMVDCVVLGPFAAAELNANVHLPNMRALPVP